VTDFRLKLAPAAALKLQISSPRLVARTFTYFPGVVHAGAGNHVDQVGTTFTISWNPIDAGFGAFGLVFLGAATAGQARALLGYARKQRSVTAAPVIAADDQILNCNISSGSPATTLPPAASRAGEALTFKDVGGQFAAHPLTLTPFGTEKIDNLSSVVLSINYQAVTLHPFNDGVNTGWVIL